MERFNELKTPVIFTTDGVVTIKKGLPSYQKPFLISDIIRGCIADKFSFNEAWAYYVVKYYTDYKVLGEDGSLHEESYPDAVDEKGLIAAMQSAALYNREELEEMTREIHSRLDVLKDAGRINALSFNGNNNYNEGKRNVVYQINVDGRQENIYFKRGLTELEEDDAVSFMLYRFKDPETLRYIPDRLNNDLCFDEAFLFTCLYYGSTALTQYSIVDWDRFQMRELLSFIIGKCWGNDTLNRFKEKAKKAVETERFILMSAK